MWISQFGRLGEARARVYRCVENLLQLEDGGKYQASLQLLFGAEALRQAKALVNREERFFGLNTLGANMEGSEMHRRLLVAHEKVQRPQRA